MRLKSVLLLALLIGLPPKTSHVMADSDDSLSESSPTETRPNIVFIMTDDQGYWDTGATGNPHIDTPFMDQIAHEGVQLNRYYAAPVCAPTRAGLMSGRYYLRTELYNTRFGGDSLGLGEITVAELLREAGYRTGMFGKWHLGKYPGYQPNDRGFDEFFGHYHGHIERYQFPDQVYHNGVPVEARGYVSDVFTDASLDFIEANVQSNQEADSSNPFFCALTYNAPHSPFLLDTSHYDQSDGDVLIEKYLGRGLPIRDARIYGLIERVDVNIGRLLKKLDELGIAEDTLVVFTSDNGGVSKFFKGGMNGNKASVYEGGVRAPCFVRWPSTIPAGKIVNAQTSHIDWMPTFCELAGATTPQDRVIDGKSLVKVLKSGQADLHHQYVYHTWDRYFPSKDRRWSISDDRWKLMCQIGADTTPDRKRWRLFDLQSDPEERTNRAQAHPEHVDRLRTEFVRWFDDVTYGIDYAPVRIPLGVGWAADDDATEQEDPTVEISPSWATWTGENIAYVFDGYDWDTIQAWKSKGEKATWRLNVQTPGTYRVKLTYGCRPIDQGGVVELSCGSGEPIRHRVRPTATADQFESFDVGEMIFAEGDQELVATVRKCPGGELMRLNKITLSRK